MKNRLIGTSLIIVLVMVSNNITPSARPTVTMKAAPAGGFKIDVVQMITRAHVPLFSQDDIFAKPLKKADVDKWYSVMGEAEKYIRSNSTDKNVNKYLDIINKANDTLINSIKIAYNTKFQDVEKILKDLKKVESDTKSLASTLKPGFITGLFKKAPTGPEADAMKALNIINATLNATATAAIKQLNKKVQKTNEAAIRKTLQ